jgi:CubicO group peptidase (beta-lactamase class C family)
VRRWASALRWLGLAALALLLTPFPVRGGWAQSSRGEVRGELGKQLDGLLRRLAAYGFSGSLLVARHGQVLIDMGYGQADPRGVPFTADTLFDVASISKQFTAAAILRLEMDGKLRVEDPLGKFFPEAPEDKAGITLHQLLTHTSGLEDTVGSEYEPIGRDELVRRLLASKLLLRPGKRFRYSNAGYSLLAAIAEKVSGEPLGRFLRERLFLPAGMHHTGYRLPAWEHPVLAHGFGPDGDWGTPLDHPWADDGPYWNLRGNGGVMSTTGDLYRWHLALRGTSVLAAAERDKAITPYISEGRASHSHYGYGWSITSSPTGTRLISHIGGNGIFEADFRRYLDDEAVIVISSNRADFSALAVSPHVEARLYGQPDPEPPWTGPFVPAAAARCAGDYPLEGGESLRVTAREGRLEVEPSGANGFALLAGAMSREARDNAADHRERVATALAAALKGDEAPFATLVGLEPREANQLLHTSLDPAVGHLGAWQGADVLGDAMVGGHPYTFARFTFARGSRFAAFLWEDTVESLRLGEQAFAMAFLPVAGQSAMATQFAAYEVRDGITLTLRCEPGPPSRLLLPTPSGERRLTALPHP